MLKSLSAVAFVTAMGAGTLFAVNAASASPTTPLSLAGSSWNLTYCWTGTSCGSTTWTFERGGKVAEGDYPGGLVKFSSTHNGIVVYFPNTTSYVCEAAYSGQVSGTSMTGLSETDGNGACQTTGTWSATRTSASVNTHSSARANGQR